MKLTKKEQAVKDFLSAYKKLRSVGLELGSDSNSILIIDISLQKKELKRVDDIRETIKEPAYRDNQSHYSDSIIESNYIIDHIPL